MTEHAKRIAELNDASVAVSKKIQELVGGQLANMTTLEARSVAQTRIDEERQKSTEVDAKKNIELLKRQVYELENKRDSLVSDNAINRYKEIREKIM